MTDPRVLSPACAPTPFTAAEIRAACRPGLTQRVRVYDGDDASVRVNRYVTCDDEGAEVERTTGDQVSVARVSWRELQGHASFPLADTTITVERIGTPLGELECRRYDVRDGDDLRTLWFAVDLPGMPVRTQAVRGGQVVSRTELESVDLGSGS